MRVVRAHAPAFALAGGALILMLAIAYGVFRAHPYCMDEYGYLYQAEIFAGGHTSIDAPSADLQGLREMYVIWNDGQVFSKYPPGFSMVLAIGVKLGAPASVNPLLGAITLLLLYVVVHRLLGRRYALIAQLIVATNPFFVAYSASLFAHTLSLALVMAVLVILTDPAPPAPRRWLALGTALGAIVWVRPVDALAACVFTAFTVVRMLGWKQAVRAGAIAAGPFLAFLLGLMTYNAAVAGRFALSSYPVLQGEFRLTAGKPDFVDNLTTIADEYVRRLVNEGEVLWGRYFVWPAGVLVPLLALAAILLRSGLRSWRIALAFHFVVVILLYNFHGMPSPIPTWPQYGARYWYSGFGAVVVLAMLAISDLARRVSTRTEVIAIAVLIAIQLAIGIELFVSYAERFAVQAAISADIEATCPGKRLVELELPRRSRLPPFVEAPDFKRNPFFTGEKLFVIGHSPSAEQALPDHVPCRYDFARW